MLNPVYVHTCDAFHSHGITVTDFSGCFSAADDLQDLPRVVQEAVEVWCKAEGMDLPGPTALEELAAKTDFTGGFWLALMLTFRDWMCEAIKSRCGSTCLFRPTWCRNRSSE
jgi:predicted RNase H-like HicB family nuclease